MSRTPKWTLEKVRHFARRCSSRAEFSVRYPKAYRAAQYHGWLNELGLPKNAQTIKWSLNALKKEAAKHQRLELFRRANPGAYQTAWRKGWLGELGLKRGLALQEVSEIAEQYFTRTAFYKGSRRAYDAAKLNGWLDSLLPRYAVRAPRV